MLIDSLPYSAATKQQQQSDEEVRPVIREPVQDPGPAGRDFTGL